MLSNNNILPSNNTTAIKQESNENINYNIPLTMSELKSTLKATTKKATKKAQQPDQIKLVIHYLNTCQMSPLMQCYPSLTGSGGRGKYPLHGNTRSASVYPKQGKITLNRKVTDR